MRLSKPSPAMVVAVTALVMATTGGAVAAVNFARNAGAVDGKSAVSARASLGSARGKLVATARRGPNAGRIPGKFLADVVATQKFGRALDVTDNATGAAVDLSNLFGLGKLTASCQDEDKKAGNEDPASAVTFANGSGSAVNSARRVGTGSPVISAVANATVDQFTIKGSNTFSYHLELAGSNVLVDGVVRQDGRDTTGASCLVYGTVLLVR